MEEFVAKGHSPCNNFFFYFFLEQKKVEYKKSNKKKNKNSYRKAGGKCFKVCFAAIYKYIVGWR